MHISASLLAITLAAGQLVAAHPGEDHAEEARKRGLFLRDNAANLDHCADKLHSAGVTARSMQRRHEMMRGIRAKRGIAARSSDGRFDAQDAQIDQTAVFKGTSSCVLSPDETEGPYYVAGEYVRSNVVEDQPGIPLHVDVQFINSATCEPVAGSYVDLWQANATGTYSGVVQFDAGMTEPAPEQANAPWEDTWGTTYLRGVQETDADGAVHFETIFPGHYEGRTVHIHVLTHLDATVLPNNTVVDARASYVGQMYFDQDLVDAVSELPPYSGNTNPKTTNDEDWILQGDLRAGGYPFMQYELLGDRLEDGLMAWLSFGINATVDREVHAITTYHPRKAQEECTQCAAAPTA